MNHPGGQTCALGGAYTVHPKPVHFIAGKMVRVPMVLPCVLEEAENECPMRFVFYTREREGQAGSSPPTRMIFMFVDAVPFRVMR